MIRQAAPLHNLPMPATSFIGRETQLDALHQALKRTRLITLTGAGSCGKTRLALELASAHLPSYADGVWLVALEPLHDPALVPQAVAEALGLPSKHMLLLLDNCEHLVTACRQLAERLLRDCPRLTILATSDETAPMARVQYATRRPPRPAVTAMASLFTAGSSVTAMWAGWGAAGGGRVADRRGSVDHA